MKQPDSEEPDLTEAEIAARFESTVRRMANTKPVPRTEGKGAKVEGSQPHGTEQDKRRES